MKGNTLHVMFFILKNKLLKNGEAPVVLRVTINGQRDEIRIQRSIPVELWDNAKMRSKGRGRSSAELNMYLETLRDRIYVIHRNSVYDGERLTPKKILDILYAREGRHLVLKAMKECIDGWAASPGDLHPATLARYNRCYGLVETVIRNVYNKEDIVFSELDRKFITAFERYLKETRGLARNTAAKYLECFRKVLKVAQQKGWMEHGKFLEELLAEVGGVGQILLVRHFEELVQHESRHFLCAVLVDEVHTFLQHVVGLVHRITVGHSGAIVSIVEGLAGNDVAFGSAALHSRKRVQGVKVLQTRVIQVHQLVEISLLLCHVLLLDQHVGQDHGAIGVSADFGAGGFGEHSFPRFVSPEIILSLVTVLIGDNIT
mgnify:CR=1 FL=1